MKKLYAAYGSNLNMRQMRYRCPDAEVFETAMLNDHRMVFRGHPYGAVATVEPDEGSSVPVLLWEISERDEKSLDRYEGYPSFYDKAEMEFELNGKFVSAMVYVMTPGHTLGYPSKSYYETIAEGYEDCGFDVAYLEHALIRTEELMEIEQTQEQGEQNDQQMFLW